MVTVYSMSFVATERKYKSLSAMEGERLKLFFLPDSLGGVPRLLRPSEGVGAETPLIWNSTANISPDPSVVGTTFHRRAIWNNFYDESCTCFPNLIMSIQARVFRPECIPVKGIKIMDPDGRGLHVNLSGKQFYGIPSYVDGLRGNMKASWVTFEVQINEQSSTLIEPTSCDWKSLGFFQVLAGSPLATCTAPMDAYFDLVFVALGARDLLQPETSEFLPLSTDVISPRAVRGENPDFFSASDRVGFITGRLVDPLHKEGRLGRFWSEGDAEGVVDAYQGFSTPGDFELGDACLNMNPILNCHLLPNRVMNQTSWLLPDITDALQTSLLTDGGDGTIILRDRLFQESYISLPPLASRIISVHTVAFPEDSFQVHLQNVPPGLQGFVYNHRHDMCSLCRGIPVFMIDRRQHQASFIQNSLR